MAVAMNALQPGPRPEWKRNLQPTKNLQKHLSFRTTPKGHQQV